MKRNKKAIVVFDILVLLLLFLFARGRAPADTIAQEAPNVSSLADLSYAEHPYTGYTVYIEEEGGYQPYYVLTNSFNGQQGTVLLLRKYCLDELKEYHPMEKNAYRTDYESSSLDEYLNGEFLETLPPLITQNIVDSTISIPDIAIEPHNASAALVTRSIVRKVFLPSFAELGFNADFLQADAQTRSKYLFYPVIQTGDTISWWTREPVFYHYSQLWVIRPQTVSFFSGNAGELHGVRPAFCLSGDLPTEWRLDDAGFNRYVCPKS